MGTLAAGSVLAALAPSTGWAVELKTLSTAEGEALMKMGRTLYPHKKLPDAVYALLAKDLDAKARPTPPPPRLLRDGVAALDKAAGGASPRPTTRSGARSSRRSKASRSSLPCAASASPRCTTTTWPSKAFGYPGSSWEKGGYITRGFQDLKWLPAPPLDGEPETLRSD